MYSYGPPHMAGEKQDDQLEHTFSRYVRIRDVALKTYHMRWTIGRSGEIGPRISVPAARHDDDDVLSDFTNWPMPLDDCFILGRRHSAWTSIFLRSIRLSTYGRTIFYWIEKKNNFYLFYTCFQEIFPCSMADRDNCREIGREREREGESEWERDRYSNESARVYYYYYYYYYY